MAKRLGLDAGFVFHEKFPDEVIPRLGPLDFAFIDASHLFDLTLMEFVLVDRKLKVGGVVGFHDLWMPSLQKLVRFILGNRSYRLINRRPLPPVSLPKRLVLRALNSNQKFQRYFSRNLLDPFSAMGIPNLVLFEKMQDDQRDWRHFADF